MKRNHLINMAWMQALWFAAVIGAAHKQTWPAVIILLTFAWWQLEPSRRQSSDLQIIPVAVFIGMVLDSSWIKLGWIQFSNPEPVPHMAPIWILLLWTGLALTVNHSLGWLQGKLVLAGSVSGLVSPFSYLAAQRLGAVHIISDSWSWFFGLAICWALALPFLLWLAGHLQEINSGKLDV